MRWKKRRFATIELVKHIRKYDSINNFGAKGCSFFPRLASKLPYAFIALGKMVDNGSTYLTLFILVVYHRCQFWRLNKPLSNLQLLEKNKHTRPYVKRKVESWTWRKDGICDCIGVENVAMVGKCQRIRIFFVSYNHQVVWCVKVISCFATNSCIASDEHHYSLQNAHQVCK